MVGATGERGGVISRTCSSTFQFYVQFKTADLTVRNQDALQSTMNECYDFSLSSSSVIVTVIQAGL